MKKVDLLAIGDITTDAFIKLKQAHISDAVNHLEKEICFTFGDKIPYEFVKIVRAVGNAGNAATAASRLGLSTALIANIGTDQNGKECLAELRKNKILTKYVRSHKKVPTNYHYVLWYDSERTILVKHEKYPYALPKIALEPRWIYLTSLGDDSLSYHTQIISYLATHPEVKLAFQPGTYQIKFGVEKLAAIYHRAEILFCNVDEARRILRKEKDATSNDKSEIITLMESLHKLGPQKVVVTDGVKGAYILDNDVSYFMPTYPDIAPPYERTGAGDAFSATVTAALATGKTLEEALLWGPINSMSVVQYVGAQEGLLSESKLVKYLKTAPSDYKLKKIS